MKWVVPGCTGFSFELTRCCISFLGVGNVGLGLIGFDRVLPSFTGFSFECVWVERGRKPIWRLKSGPLAAFGWHLICNGFAFHQLGHGTGGAWVVFAAKVIAKPDAMGKTAPKKERREVGPRGGEPGGGGGGTTAKIMQMHAWLA